MSENNDDNLEFLKKLEEEMERHTSVRELVLDAMVASYTIRTSDKTDRRKALELGRKLQETTQKILDILREED